MMTTFKDGAPPAALTMKFSHNIIEHLGLKLYQNKPNNVLAELVANSWDADATLVDIHIDTDSDGKPQSIVIADDGIGMDLSTLVERYLVVGKAKRPRNAPAATSSKGRAFMGRKGIGKLAPFGVAKQVDLITSRSGRITWLRFFYEKMIPETDNPNKLSEYCPDPIYQDSPIDDVDENRATASNAQVANFLAKVKQSGSGTLILASKLTYSKALSEASIRESLGRRFTVTLARPDFVVSVNNVQLKEEAVYPQWELRIPESGRSTDIIATPSGSREIHFWVGFVKEASWPQEEAGVGVYAHGKIAQDRPFFFGNKGNEIHARYLYGVVEADWIDELEHDTISTDRTSIDWQDGEYSDFHTWGQAKVRDWLRTYQSHRKSVATKENADLVEDVLSSKEQFVITSSEKEHLVDLLSEVTPRLGKERENKERLVEATVKAWIHEPARKLIKKLWQEACEFNSDEFSLVVMRLADQLVPESLSVAVVFSQRVYALTKLNEHIMLGKETQLQALIEQFPWILDNRYDRYIPRKALKTICDEAQQKGLFPSRSVHQSTVADYTKPDFVFLGTPEDKEILVVELKGPDETAAWSEFEQLQSYMSFLQSRDSNANISGILIARSFEPGIEKQKPVAMELLCWKDVLLRSRRDHMEFLAALLAGTEAGAEDARVQQICELGGKTVKEFLKSMASSSESLKEIANRLGE